MAAAAALADRRFAVDLFEARTRLGGRAGGYRDAESGEILDHCQHVSMGCCTNLADFCRRTNAGEFQKSDTLTFIDPAGTRSRFAAANWLPAPLHLGPALMGLKFLTIGERLGVARAMRAIASQPAIYTADEPTIGDWLKEQGQTANAIERYWKVILVSALSETLDRISFSAARQVFVEGFMAHQNGWVMETPLQSLNEMYDENVARSLESSGVTIHRGAKLKALKTENNRVTEIVIGDQALPFDMVILALPRPQTRAVLPAEALTAESLVDDDFPTAPITSVHLWFDRPITDLPHAVFVDCTSQWLFAKGKSISGDGVESYYYQVVISASHAVNEGDRNAMQSQVIDELKLLFPDCGSAELQRCRTVTQQSAVFSTLPGIEGMRSPQATSISNLFLAGDWTKTGWPSTMEGAVRSGYLAVEALLNSLGKPEKIVVDDLPTQWLAGRVVRN